MVEQQLDEFMAGEEYQKVPSNLPEFTFYFHMENNYVNVLHVVNFKKNLYITAEQYFHIKDKIKLFFTAKNIDHVHILSLLICGEGKQVKHLCEKDPFCWVIDPYHDRLIIYENQTDDFYGMKEKIEYFLTNLPSGIKTDNLERGKKLSGFDIPYVTAGLVSVNILVFIICTFTGSLLYNKGAFSISALLENNEYYRVLTSIFLHWDIDHLISNMLILYYLGEVVEKYLGRVKYGIVYMAAGALGNLLSAAYEMRTGRQIVSAGASGAVFGVIGALFVLVCIHKGHLEKITMGRLLFMIVYSLYSGFVGTNINNAAHIGGFVGGIILTFLLYHRKIVEHENM